MNELGDRVYKFVVIGRIFFVATCLITAILLTVTAVKASNTPRTVSVEEPDLSLNITKDDVEIPITGEEVEFETEQPDTAESEKSSEAPANEALTETPAEQSASTEVEPQPSYTTPVEQSRPSIPSTPSQQKPAFDYDKIYYTDDNGQPEADSIPVIANDPSTPVTDDLAEGVIEE